MDAPLTAALPKPAFAAVLEDDFKPFLTTVRSYYTKREENRQKRALGEMVSPEEPPYPAAAYSTVLRDGIPWFNDRREENWRTQGFANPEDYAAIRDDPAALRGFVERILSMAPYEYGHDRDGSSGLMEPAEYLIFLHHQCENQSFKQALEELVAEVLAKELAKEPPRLDLTSTRGVSESHLARMWPGENFLIPMLARDNLHGALYRLDLAGNCSPTDAAMRDRLCEALKRTERPITLEEVLRTYGGTEASLRDLYKRGNFTATMSIHPEELPADLVADVRQWYVERDARRRAEEAASPQLVRLLSSLMTAAHIGRPDNVIGSLSGELQRRLEDGSMRKLAFRSYRDVLRPYRYLVEALQASLGRDTVHDVWLRALSNAKEREDLTLLFHAGVAEGNEDDSIRFASKSLGILRDALSVEKAAPECLPRSIELGDTLARTLAHSFGYERGIYSKFHESSKAIELLEVATTSGVSTGSRTLLTEHAIAKGTLTFDASNGKFLGKEDAVPIMEEYFQTFGVPLSNEVSVTSLRFRVVEGDSYLFRGLTMRSAPAVEGIVEVNGRSILFVLGSDEYGCRFALPDTKARTAFSLRSRKEERNSPLIPSEVLADASTLSDLTSLRHAVSERASEERRRGVTSEADRFERDLNEEVLSALEPFIRTRLRAKVV